MLSKCCLRCSCCHCQCTIARGASVEQASCILTLFACVQWPSSKHSQQHLPLLHLAASLCQTHKQIPQHSQAQLQQQAVLVMTRMHWKRLRCRSDIPLVIHACHQLFNEAAKYACMMPLNSCCVAKQNAASPMLHYTPTPKQEHSATASTVSVCIQKQQLNKACKHLTSQYNGLSIDLKKHSFAMQAADLDLLLHIYVLLSSAANTRTEQSKFAKQAQSYAVAMLQASIGPSASGDSDCLG